jgi:hypothetical protein
MMIYVVHIFEDGRSAKTVSINAKDRVEAQSMADRITAKYHARRSLHDHLNYVEPML